MSTIKSSSEDLTVTSDGTDKHTLIQDNGVTKLATTATGVDVTGTATATAFVGDGSGLTNISGAGEINDLSDAITDGEGNVGIGSGALSSPLLTGIQNTANGVNALYSNTTGIYNTANGFESLRENTEGDRNTATGRNALENNTTGVQNTAIGLSALQSNTEGGYNTATGVNALNNNTTGINNTAVGVGAGGQSLLSNNTYLGRYIGTATDSSKIFLSAGSSLYQMISGPVTKGGVPVMHLVVSTDEETGEILDQVRVVDEHLMRDKIATAIEPLLAKIKTLEERLK